jgi:hypothetical protein
MRSDEFNKEDGAIDFDVVTELVFPDRAAYLAWAAELSKPGSGEQVVADELNFPEQEIHDFIDVTKGIAAHGNREMPVWGLAFQYREGTIPHSNVPPLSRDEVNQESTRLVDYIKSIQAP